MADNPNPRLNHNDIENLEDKVDGLSNDIQDLDETVRKILLEGDGSKPLTIKVAKNSSKLENTRCKIRRIYAILGSLPFVASAIIGMLKFVW